MSMVRLETIGRRPDGGVYKLGEMLALLADRGAEYQWAVLNVEAVGDISTAGYGELELEQLAADSERGLVLSWDKLQQLAALWDDVCEITLVGCRPTSALPSRAAVRARSCEVCDVVISLVDSDTWELCFSDAELARRIQRATTLFRGVPS